LKGKAKRLVCSWQKFLLIFSGGKWLYDNIKKLFSSEEGINHSHNLSDTLTLDVFLPNLNLAFEYQPYIHSASFITPSWAASVPQKPNPQLEKQQRVKELEPKLTLITIPYWWYAQSKLQLLSISGGAKRILWLPP
jgi:hypothetical protein